VEFVAASGNDRGAIEVARSPEQLGYSAMWFAAGPGRHGFEAANRALIRDLVRGRRHWNHQHLAADLSRVRGAGIRCA
jgi:hypothetical protein